MPEGEFRKLKEYANNTGRTISGTVRIALRRFLKEDEKNAEA